jgi:hypothetical protein
MGDAVVLRNPLDDAASFATTATVSNDLRFAVLHLRPFSRFAFWREGFPQHQLGVELSVDFVGLGVDDRCFGLGD